MRELQKLIDDLRAGDKTLEALSLSHYELQQMVDDMREMCADGSAGGVGILEEQMNTLQKIGDEMCAGETLEALAFLYAHHCHCPCFSPNALALIMWLRNSHGLFHFIKEWSNDRMLSK